VIILWAGARMASRKVRRSSNQVGHRLRDPTIGALFTVSLFPNVWLSPKTLENMLCLEAVAVIAAAVGIRLRGPSFIEPSTVSPLLSVGLAGYLFACSLQCLH